MQHPFFPAFIFQLDGFGDMTAGVLFEISDNIGQVLSLWRGDNQMEVITHKNPSIYFQAFLFLAESQGVK